jgi:hypothetical protein
MARHGVRWFFKLLDEELAEWFWDDSGAPPLEQLRAVRNPRSSENNRHIPVTAYSTTMAAHICLESGLEHDLLRRVDRDPAVRLIVAQPLRLAWPGTKSGSRSRINHTPDLLTADANGTVTLWDVRAEDRWDDDFRTKVELTRHACQDFGWRYELFTGLGSTERLNLLWLHGFRRRPAWAGRFEGQIRSAAAASGATLGGLFALDDGTGGGISTAWHLLWRGDIAIDMEAPMTERAPITLGKAKTNG